MTKETHTTIKNIANIRLYHQCILLLNEHTYEGKSCEQLCSIYVLTNAHSPGIAARAAAQRGSAAARRSSSARTSVWCMAGSLAGLCRTTRPARRFASALSSEIWPPTILVLVCSSCGRSSAAEFAFFVLRLIDVQCCSAVVANSCEPEEPAILPAIAAAASTEARLEQVHRG